MNYIGIINAAAQAFIKDNIVYKHKSIATKLLLK